MDVPVDSAPGAAGGYALATDYPLAPLPLNHREALLLLVALDGLQRLTTAPFGDARTTLAAKLRAMLAGEQRVIADRWLDKVSLDIPPRPGQTAPFLDALLTAAQNGGWIAARYRAESGDPAAHTLQPRALTTRNGFWYCRAWSHERGAERTFRVDRFVAAQTTAPPTDTEATAEPTPYEHPDHPQIHVCLTAQGAAFAETEQHVGHRVARSSDGTGTLTFRCPPHELDFWARYFFRLSDDATVVEPPKLRARIRALSEKISAAYAEP